MRHWHEPNNFNTVIKQREENLSNSEEKMYWNHFSWKLFDFPVIPMVSLFTPHPMEAAWELEEKLVECFSIKSYKESQTTFMKEFGFQIFFCCFAGTNNG